MPTATDTAPWIPYPATEYMHPAFAEMMDEIETGDNISDLEYRVDDADRLSYEVRFRFCGQQIEFTAADDGDGYGKLNSYGDSVYSISTGYDLMFLIACELSSRLEPA